MSPLVEIILHGRHAESLAAIRAADADTLRLAARECRIAADNAQFGGLPFRAFRQRADWCRLRLLRLEGQPDTGRGTLRL